MGILPHTPEGPLWSWTNVEGARPSCACNHPLGRRAGHFTATSWIKSHRTPHALLCRYALQCPASPPPVSHKLSSCLMHACVSVTQANQGNCRALKRVPLNGMLHALTARSVTGRTNNPLKPVLYSPVFEGPGNRLAKSMLTKGLLDVDMHLAHSLVEILQT